MNDDFALPEGAGVMLCGHGSRDGQAVDEFARLAETLCRRLAGIPFAYGYLELAEPTIADGLDRLREKGVGHVFALPAMLFAAGHVKNDLPVLLNAYAAEYGIALSFGRELGVDLKMLKAAADRIAMAERAAVPDTPRHDTLLLVVGRGASDPDANANAAKMMRMLWEGMGFGWGETAYTGVTFPLVAPALDKAAQMGFRRIVVFPYLLFTGVLVKGIHAAIDAAAAKHPQIEFVKAPYFSDHELVIDTFVERLREITLGHNNMNCALCKYREAALGFEDEVGAAQHGHHHDHDHDHDHHHHHGHDHDNDHHHHAPHPHANHPFGPAGQK